MSPGSQTLEQRVAALEQQALDLDKRINESDKRLTDEVKATQTMLTEERAARERAEAELQNKVSKISLGGLDLQIMGLVWLFVGITIATVPGPFVAVHNLIFCR